MKKLVRYIPSYPLFGLILGIKLNTFCDFSKVTQSQFFLLLVVVLAVIFLIRKEAFKGIFIFLSIVTSIILGVFISKLHNPEFNTNYYQNYSSKSKTLSLKITRVLKSNAFYHRYYAKVIKVDSIATSGKIALNIQKDSLQQVLKIGNILLVPSVAIAINKPLNPHQFNYKNYLAQRYIYEQINLKSNEYSLIRKSSNNFAVNIRYKIQQQLKRYNFNKDVYAVINALLLGQRQELSNDLTLRYANAGAIHILAISGLHIGILLKILLFLCKPLRSIKYGAVLTQVIIVGILWLFAFITGLSPSVVRAVTMFSFVSIALIHQQKQPIEHVLVLSMLVLLLLKPNYVFEVGFQLSYIAVFGIVWLYPICYKLISIKWIILDKAWQVICVSLAAQISVLPLSLFFFNQFPGLFLLSNLVVIPVLGIILGMGFLLLSLAYLEVIIPVLGETYALIINALNSIIGFIATQERFLLTNIHFSKLEVYLWYCLLILIYLLIKTKKKQLVFYSLGVVLLLQIQLIIYTIQKNKKAAFIVFHKTKSTVIGSRNGGELILYGQNYDKTDYTIKSYLIKEQLNNIKKDSLLNIFSFNKEKILVVDKLGVYNIDLKNSVVVLTQSPKINLERLIAVLKPKLIIADGSNYKSYCERWKETCEKQKTPFYQTRQNGAYLLKSN